MKRILKIEFNRAFKSLGFFLAVFIGLTIAIIHLLFFALPLALQLPSYIETNLQMMFPGWLYTSGWLLGRQTPFSYLYLLVLPILAALPHGSSFYKDAKGTFIGSICIRTDRKKYYFAKYISTFVSGGIAVIAPIVFNFIIAATLLPAITPQSAAFESLIGENSSFPFLFYNRPLLYVILYTLIIFIFSGLISTTSLVSSFYVGHSALTVILPTVVYLFISALFSVFGLDSWAANNFLDPAYPYNAVIPMMVEGIVLFVFTFYSFCIKTAREDIY